MDEAIDEGRPYHHGDLRHALIAAAETLLSEKGVEGFTLRECARRAGVSPAAPAHHFGNMRGLLTAIATLGFEGLAAAMDLAAQASGGDAEARLKAIGLGYIRFALAHPARFRVMFGRFPLDRSHAALAIAADRAFVILAETIEAQPGWDDMPRLVAEADLVLAWSVVHGFVNLALDGQMPFIDRQNQDAALMALAERVTGLLSGSIARAARKVRKRGTKRKRHKAR